MEQTMRMEHQLDAKPINRHFTQKPSQAKLGLWWLYFGCVWNTEQF